MVYDFVLLLYEWIFKSRYLLIGAFGATIFVIYGVSIIRVLLIERKIKNIEDNRDKKIQQAKNVPGVGKIIVERQISNIKDQCEPELSRLRRDRQFILDKLPFI